VAGGAPAGVTGPRIAASVAMGLGLATLPFWRYTALVGTGVAHADHAPHYGGQLGMSGEHHVELVRRGGRVEAFVSDAWRRLVRPREGWVVYDRAVPALLRWDGDRLVGADEPAAHEIETVVVLADGARLAITFVAERGDSGPGD
jgi:hypothetical protein